MQVWALGKLGAPNEQLLSAYMGHVQALLEAQQWGQQPSMHPADAARLAWGTASLAAQRLLPSRADGERLQQFWDLLMACVDYSLRWTQMNPAVLLKAE
jgi:hypothetical protein